MEDQENPETIRTQQRLQKRFSQQRQAYTLLLRGAERLLKLDVLFGTERWLLRLVRYLYRHRLEQLGVIEAQFMDTDHLKKNMLEAAVEAAVQGHELGEWQQVDETGQRWESRCTVCGRTTFVSDTVRYSVLGDDCHKHLLSNSRST